MSLPEKFEALRAEAYEAITSDRGSLGQFYTPSSVASLLSSMVEKPASRSVSLIDPGAGVGMLSAAMVSRLHELGVKEIQLTACEIAREVIPALRQGMNLINMWCEDRGITFHYTIIEGDFIEWAVEQVSDDLFALQTSRFDIAILNPPYKKLPTDSIHRRQLERVDLECTNLYAAFVYLSARLLSEGGQLVTINPRSFASGPYFRDFRRRLFAIAPLRTVHVFDRRDRAFSSDKVLQENVMLHAVRGVSSPRLQIFTSEAGEAQSTTVREISIERAISPDDPDCILHLEASVDDAEVADIVRALPATLVEIGIQVSTGRVVDFRARDGLKRIAAEDTVPLIYPQHLRNATIVWPKRGKKPDYFRPGEAYASQLVTAGTYVLTKRFSSKEEKRRISASLITKDVVPGIHYALENHVNYFHAGGKPLDDELAVGLTAYLNSTLADRYFRLYNGHTQVNATDLRALPYPPPTALRKLGRSLKDVQLVTENVDQPVNQLCREFAKKKDQGSSVGADRSRSSSRAA